MKIIGNPVGTTMPRSNWNQTDPKKADYIKGKEDVDAAIKKAQDTADENAEDITNLTETVSEKFSNFLVVGDTVPTNGPTLWFNTAPGGSVNQAAMLLLDDDESGYDMQAVVGDETYGVNNATVNQGASAGSYDFTVL